MQSLPEPRGIFQKAIDGFLLDRRANGVTAGTLRFYRIKLRLFADFCAEQSITELEGVTPDLLRCFMLALAERHNPGGCHAAYRAIRALLKWYEAEFEPDDWHSPTRRVKAPRVPLEPLTPVSLEDISAMLDTCKRGKPIDVRDRAVLFVLLDTGLRATEPTALNVEDVDFASDEILVKQGKGRKPRAVYLGAKSRKVLRAYARGRRDGPLFLARGGGRLTYEGLRDIVIRRAALAGVEPPGLHSFRRAFALNCLRSGMDVFTLKRLMGHTSLAVLNRYLDQTNEDLLTAHRAASPADRL